MERLDGISVRNARETSIQFNRNAGLLLTPLANGRLVPASRPISVTLVGRTQYAAPILALAGTVYVVKGTLNVTLEPNKHYVVRGELGESSSSVWLEEADTQSVVGTKIQVEGAAKAGLLDW